MNLYQFKYSVSRQYRGVITRGILREPVLLERPRRDSARYHVDVSVITKHLCVINGLKTIECCGKTIKTLRMIHNAIDILGGK